METWSKIFFGICALISIIIGIAMFAGWIACKNVPTCITDVEDLVDLYWWGINPEWIALGIWWGIGAGIPLWVLFMVLLFRHFD